MSFLALDKPRVKAKKLLNGKGWVDRDPPIVKIKVLSARRKDELKKLFSEVRRAAASGRAGLASRAFTRKPARRAKRGAPWAAAAEGRRAERQNVRSSPGA